MCVIIQIISFIISFRIILYFIFSPLLTKLYQRESLEYRIHILITNFCQNVCITKRNHLIENVKIGLWLFCSVESLYPNFILKTKVMDSSSVKCFFSCWIPTDLTNITKKLKSSLFLTVIYSILSGVL